MSYISQIKSYILNQIKEEGDFNLKFVIPHFKRIKYDYTINAPLFDFSENYAIDVPDINEVQSVIETLLKENPHLGLFEYVSEKGFGYKWNDSLNILNDSRSQSVLFDKDTYLGKNSNPYYIGEVANSLIAGRNKHSK
ncbi:hypothetical protein [Aequorivita sp. CIP111184]|uniref:hypothetical protein n=1 Tax=Aequorivita sp. CIP111184 TaxID=2211356 RepID=UPI000DBC2165|nr:hypothetical protein [Aequorivita sp. CIP111184]SRX52235.1 hypothetical protein AEQU1_00098 [Aequorivita sp. CIP111184]